MRILTVTILFLFSIPVSASFSVDVINNILSSNNISFGTIDMRLCDSPSLVSMASLSDGINNGICINDRTNFRSKIHLIIPLRIVLSSSEPVNITFIKTSNGYDFDGVSLRNIKNQVLGGGIDLLNTSIPLNNQTINAELEISVLIAGAGALSSYSNEIEISITPGI